MDVENKSAGIWKAVVIGSYERCDRALSVKKAVSLANFYQVPLEELLGIQSKESVNTSGKVTLDIRATTNENPYLPELVALRNFATLICTKRHDWNGEVLSIRNSDLTTIGLLINRDEASAYEWLSANRLLLNK